MFRLPRRQKVSPAKTSGFTAKDPALPWRAGHALMSLQGLSTQKGFVGVALALLRLTYQETIAFYILKSLIFFTKTQNSTFIPVRFHLNRFEIQVLLLIVQAVLPNVLSVNLKAYFYVRDYMQFTVCAPNPTNMNCKFCLQKVLFLSPLFFLKFQVYKAT